jgi:hypothetical protein
MPRKDNNLKKSAEEPFKGQLRFTAESELEY